MVSFADKLSDRVHTRCQVLSKRAADFSYLAGLIRSTHSNRSWTADAGLYSQVPRRRRGWTGDLSSVCSRIASLVKTAGSLQSLSDHSTYTIQRWTSGAARYCLPGETRGLPLQINLSVRSNSGGNE